MKITQQQSQRHVLTVTVDNEAGILAKIAGLFTARGYNIDSLTVADISENHAVSRITIVTHGPESVIDQIHAQLERLVPVHKVTDLTEVGPHVERELALIKVGVRADRRAELLDVAASFRASVVDMDSDTIVLEAVCSPGRLESLLAKLDGHGTCELVRSGMLAIARGSGTITDTDDSDSENSSLQAIPA